ncbi:MAG: ABC transporter ATP-binding protein [Planctomycetota bacterium]
MALLEVKNLRVRFDTHHGVVRAVDGVTFQLEEGETLGLVGESGSGKSVTNLALMGLVPTPPGVVEADALRVEGCDVLEMSEKELRQLRGNDVSMIFQDPMTSLNPLLTIGRQLTEVLEVHERMTRSEARRRSAEGLADVGIPDPTKRLDQYPHELSGGMRQRVMIAMALLCRPKVLLADEPTTALDVTIQAQILELMKSLQRDHGTAIVLVTHDLGVVAGMSDRVNVMYAGKLVETADALGLFSEPRHPYTRGLLGSVPRLTGNPNVELESIPGSPPDLADLPPGCAFHPRCAHRVDRCESDAPPLYPVGDSRRTACFEHDRLGSTRRASRETPVVEIAMTAPKKKRRTYPIDDPPRRGDEQRGEST